jgi:tetratricopeptide (TPR) repeat protein
LCLFSSLAQADARSQARQQFRLGSQHYHLGEYQQALEAFKEAYRKVEDPIFLYNIAQCQRQLDQKRDALRSYRAYLNTSADPPNREQVQQLIRQLDADITAEEQKAEQAAAAAAASRPAVTTTTTDVTPAPALAVSAAPLPPARKATPAYKKWWVWTIAGVGAAGLATGLAVGLSGGHAPSASTSLGTYNPSF